MSADTYIPRKQTLTDADLSVLQDILEQNLKHQCKFHDLRHEDIDKIRMITSMFDRIGAKVIDGIVWFILASVIGVIVLLYNHGLIGSK